MFKPLFHSSLLILAAGCGGSGEKNTIEEVAEQAEEFNEEAAAPTEFEPCLVDGVFYDADGAIYGCEGGGNWCMNAPPQPGICNRTTNKEVPPGMLGHWGYASGVCRGYTFKIHADKVEYLAGMESIGAGRILGVTAKNSGLLTIETILENRGKFLSLWPAAEKGVMVFGTGTTVEASMVSKCEVMKW